jgi:Tol biopolymer transport system component
MSAAFSPNGEQIAYAWHNEQDFDDLRLIRADGSDQKLLFSDPDVRSVTVNDWIPDGSRILVTLVRFDSTVHVAHVPTSGGSVEVIASQSLSEALPQAMAVSPDGQFIAYDASTGRDGSAHDVYIMTAEGSSPKVVVQHPADDRLLGWSPHGDRILIASDRTGSVDLWSLPVFDGDAAGELDRLKRDVGQFTPLGLARDGSYYYGVRHFNSHLYIADLDHETGELEGSPEVVTPAMHNSGVEWSPDGHYLAFARSGGGVRQASWVLVVRGLDTGDETEFALPIDVLHRLRPSWSPDGHSILVHGWQRGAYPKEGVYTVRVETGELTTLFASESVWDRLFDWLGWSADGNAVFFRDEGRSRGDSAAGIVMRDLGSGRETDLYREIFPPYPGRLAPSPDGRKLAFCLYDSSTRTDALNIMSLPGAEYHTILQLSSASIWPPAWTDDSRHLVYMSDGHLWRISASGGEPEDLGALPSERYTRFLLSVHPNGDRIAFVAETESRSELWRIEKLFPAR